jgi:hypothetical protein
MLNEPTALIKKVPEPDYPWDRQTDESPEAFEAFATYRDLGAFRSITAVVQKWHKSRSLIGRWSAAHGWVQRVDAWDAWNDQEFRKEREDERRRVLASSLELGSKMRQAALDSLSALLDSGATLPVALVPVFAEKGSKLARQALGLDTPWDAGEQEAQNRMAMQAIQGAIDAADKETGDRVRANLYRLEKECAAGR